MWLGTFGYVLLYYGAKLWTGQPVGMSDIFSLGPQTPTIVRTEPGTGNPINSGGGVGTAPYGPPIPGRTGPTGHS